MGLRSTIACKLHMLACMIDPPPALSPGELQLPEGVTLELIHEAAQEAAEGEVEGHLFPPYPAEFHPRAGISTALGSSLVDMVEHNMGMGLLDEDDEDFHECSEEVGETLEPEGKPTTRVYDSDRLYV